MWVYKQLNVVRWVVGFYDPNGTWHTDQEFDDKDQAAFRVRWLNGGN